MVCLFQASAKSVWLAACIRGMHGKQQGDPPTWFEQYFSVDRWLTS